MNKLNLENKRDFALTTDALAFMQNAYEAFEKFGYLGGDNYIVSGCVLTGSSMSSGYMFLKGRLMPFNGGTIASNVQIIATTQTITVDTGTREQTTYRAEFGPSATPENNVPWSEIKKLDSIKDIMTKVLSLEMWRNYNHPRWEALEDADISLNALIGSNAAAIVNVEALRESNTTRLIALEKDSGLLEITSMAPEITIEIGDVRQIGKMVNIALRFKKTATMPEGAQPLMLLPSGISKPADRVFVTANTGNQLSNTPTDSQAFFIRETDGVIGAFYVGGLIIDRQYYINVSYFA